LGVARLFGDPTINVVPATPALRDGTPVFDLSGTSLSLPRHYAQVAGKACMLGIRPEALTVEETASPESFPVEVVAITPLNEKSVLLLRTADGRELLAAEAGNEEVSRRHGPAHARFDPDAVLVFDAASGRRIPPHLN
jgi:multiple sugar transport system ATP-binding protein